MVNIDNGDDFYYLPSYSGAISLSNQIFPEQLNDMLLRDVNCNGTEDSILLCNHNNRDSFCGPRDDAGVVCQGK